MISKASNRNGNNTARRYKRKNQSVKRVELHKEKQIDTSKAYKDCIAILRARYGQSLKPSELCLLYCNELGIDPVHRFLHCDFLVDRFSNNKCAILNSKNANRFYSKPKEIVPEFYLSLQWRMLRRSILMAYGKVCMNCGNKSNIHVDHIKPKSKFPELAMDPMNLQVLCKICNESKSDLHFTDYRTLDQIELIKSQIKSGKVSICDPSKLRVRNRKTTNLGRYVSSQPSQLKPSKP